MSTGTLRAAITISALLALAGAARADEISSATQSSPPVATQAPASPPAQRPLAAALGNAGIDTGGINISGFVEGSYTASFDSPPGNLLTGRVFELDGNEQLLLNQVDLSFEKALDAGKLARDDRFDLGGKVEILYGSDARFIHANGMNFYGGASPQIDPENQFDLVQAYADIGIPLGNGLVIRAGKFVTLLGYETINPTTNPFDSHSYSFGYAIPFTQTGVLALYSFNDKLSITGGLTRGWDQSLKDSNSAVDGIVQLKYAINDKLTSYFNLSVGPQITADSASYTMIIENIINYQATDVLSFGTDSLFAWQPHGGSLGQTAQWYGVTLYSGYKINDSMQLNARAEWFADPEGARGLGGNEYEFTMGAAVKPFPHDNLGENFVIRPEVRYDYSQNAIFNAGSNFDQWTFGVDAFFQF
jgi:hypothetical protein